MRLLIYAIDFTPKIGGEETSLLMLAGGLAERFYGMGSSGTKGGAESVIVVTRTRAEGFDDTTLPFPVVRRPGLAKFWRLLGEADVVQISGPVLLPLLLGWLRGKPIVVTHHMYHSVCPNGSLWHEPTGTLCPGHFAARHYRECLRCTAASVGPGKSLPTVLMTFLRRWLCKRASANVGVTRYVSRRIALPNIETIYIGIPDPLVTGESISNGRSVDKTWGFAYVGRLVKEKGLPLLLEAIKRLRDGGYDCRLKIIGDGPERARLAAKAASMSLQDAVHFTGFLQGQALHTATADVTGVVMPSVCEETAGLAAMEQMMRGGLVIASDIGGLGEVVAEAGVKFSVGDVHGLTNCLRQAMDQPAWVSEIGCKGRARALKLFGKDRMLDEYHKLYEKLLFRKKG